MNGSRGFGRSTLRFLEDFGGADAPGLEAGSNALGEGVVGAGSGCVGDVDDAGAVAFGEKACATSL